jgi:hypothetical protein
LAVTRNSTESSHARRFAVRLADVDEESAARHAQVCMRAVMSFDSVAPAACRASDNWRRELSVGVELPRPAAS